MSVNYIDKTTGDLIRVAGQGKAEYGASTVRKGTVTVAVDPQQYTTVPITFATPMPDADYLVDVSFPTQQPISYYVVNNRTKNGFQLFIKNEGGGSADASVTYTAFKLYTDTEYNNLLNNAVLTSDVTDSITNGDMNPVTSNAVAEALDDKVDKVTGKGLSTEDYTTAEKTKLAGLSNYTLPSATQNALGGIKIWVDSHNNLQISTQ